MSFKSSALELPVKPIEDLGAVSALDTSDLSEEQRATALAVLLGENVLITGNAGTGKTHLLNWLRRHAPMSVTASTGIAALAIKGCTINSWARLGFGDDSAAKIVANMREAFTKWRDPAILRLQSAERLVIDEISMLSADLLDLLDDVLRLARDIDEPFGGVQMVFCGDFLQLPPVAKSKQKVKFAFESAAWETANIKVHLLTKTFRQEDELFARVLNKIRFDNLDEEVTEFLHARHAAIDDDPEHPPCILHSHNDGCARVNTEQLNKLPGVMTELECEETAKNPAFAKQLDNDCLAPRCLRVKRGARVMLLVNYDLGRGLANGSLGIVRGGVVNKFLEVEFDNGVVESFEHEEWKLKKGDEVVATRKQFPFRLAWSITTHKSQGLTLSKVEAHLSKVFAEGQSYVALSRARTAEGLFIRGSKMEVKTHLKAVKFYQTHSC